MHKNNNVLLEKWPNYKVKLMQIMQTQKFCNLKPLKSWNSDIAVFLLLIKIFEKSYKAKKNEVPPNLESTIDKLIIFKTVNKFYNFYKNIAFLI